MPDRDDHSHQIDPVGLDEFPIDWFVVEEGVDVAVSGGWCGPVEVEVFPVPDSW